MIVYSIRQIDHAFIPLSFHWSGRYKCANWPERSLFTIVIQCSYAIKPVLGYGQEIVTFPIRETVYENVHMSPKSKFMELNSHLQ